MLKRTYLKTFAGLIVFSLACGYLVYIVSIYLNDIRSLDFFWGVALCYSLIISVVANALNSLVWHFSLRGHGVVGSPVSDYRAWVFGRICRYIPGKIFGYALRASLYSKADRHHVVAASVTDVFVSLLPLVLLTMFLSTTTGLFLDYRKMLVLSSMVLIVCAFGFFGFLKIIKTKLGGHRILGALKSVDYFSLSVASVLMCLVMLLHGWAFTLLVEMYTQGAAPFFWGVVFCLLLSGVVGQLSFIVPAGLGVREAALTFSLTQLGVAPDVALLLSVLSRLVLIASEVINCLIAASFTKSNG